MRRQQGNSAQLLTTIMSSDYEYSDDDGDYYDEDDVMNIDEEGELVLYLSI